MLHNLSMYVMGLDKVYQNLMKESMYYLRDISVVDQKGLDLFSLPG